MNSYKFTSDLFTVVWPQLHFLTKVENMASLMFTTNLANSRWQNLSHNSCVLGFVLTAKYLIVITVFVRMTLVLLASPTLLFSIGTAMEQPWNFWYANTFQIWIAMGNQSDNKLEWNIENYIVLRCLVPALQHVERWWGLEPTFVPL